MFTNYLAKCHFRLFSVQTRPHDEFKPKHLKKYFMSTLPIISTNIIICTCYLMNTEFLFPKNLPCVGDSGCNMIDMIRVELVLKNLDQRVPKSLSQ